MKLLTVLLLGGLLGGLLLAGCGQKGPLVQPPATTQSSAGAAR